MYIGCCTGHSCRHCSSRQSSQKALHHLQVVHGPHTRESWSSQPAQPAGEGEAASLVQLTEDLTDTAQTLYEETDKLHSPMEQSSMERKILSLTPNLLLSSGVSCASISSTNCGSRMFGSSWNSAMLLFLATPLRAATPNFCTSVCGILYCRSRQ